MCVFVNVCMCACACVCVPQKFKHHHTCRSSAESIPVIWRGEEEGEEMTEREEECLAAPEILLSQAFLIGLKREENNMCAHTHTHTRTHRSLTSRPAKSALSAAGGLKDTRKGEGAKRAKEREEKKRPYPLKLTSSMNFFSG